MMARVFAWSLVALFCYGVWAYGSKWHSPWALPKSPVVSALPAAAPGCGEGCK